MPNVINIVCGKSMENRKIRTAYLFIAPTILFFIITFILPAIYAIFLSLSNWTISGKSEFVGLAHYIDVLQDKMFWKALKNTLGLTLMSVPITMTLALMVALIFKAASTFPLHNLFRAIYFLPFITSAVAVAFVWSWIYEPEIGLLNAFLKFFGIGKQLWISGPKQVLPSLAIMNIWARLGFDMIIFWTGLQGIPEVYYEVSRMDGAGSFTQFRKITLPLLNPQIVLVGVLEIIFALKIFDLVFISTGGGPVNSSRVVVMHIYDLAFSWNKMGEASVVAIYLFVLIMAISIIQWKIVSRKVEY